MEKALLALVASLPEKLKEHLGGIYELELRFHPYAYDHSVPFHRVKSHYNLRNGTTISDQISGNKYEEEGEVILRKIGRNEEWIRKTSQTGRDENLRPGLDELREQYGLILEVAEERQIAPVIEPIEFDTVRNKFRYSGNLTLGGTTARLDLTEVREPGEGTSRPRYEVELEYVSGPMEGFVKLAVRLFRIYHDTRFEYTLPTFRETIRFLNEHLSRDTEAVEIDERDLEVKLDKGLVFQLRDLTYEDLTEKGLSSDEYRVSYKTDGVRKLLVVIHTGVVDYGLGGQFDHSHEVRSNGVVLRARW